MSIWIIHKISSRRWEEIVSDSLGTEIVGICPSIASAIHEMREYTIIF
jgi:hypothetical protein